MATAIKHVEEFNSANPELWDLWIETLEFYLQANKIEDVFLSLVDPATYEIDRSEPSQVVQRFQLHKRHKHVRKSVSTYITKLRKIAKHCNFGVSLDAMLMNCLVCGLKDGTLKRRLSAQ